MQLDVAHLSLLFQAAGFLALVCGGYGAFVALRKDAEHHAKALERIEGNQQQHAADDKEQFAEIRLAMKADQAATANLHTDLKEARWELAGLQKWRDRQEERQ